MSAKATAAREAEAVARLLAGEPLAQVAEALGWSERQFRRVRSRPRFLALLRAAQGVALREARARIAGATGIAIETLISVTSDTGAPIAVRTTAATRLLELGLSIVAVADLEERISLLEESDAGGQAGNP